MKKFSLLLAIALFAFNLSSAQIKRPDKRPFNMGILSGLGGLNFTPIPELDIHYKGNILRLAPGYKVLGAGYIREILPLSPEIFYNWYWIGSLYGAMGTKENIYGLKPGETVVSNYYRAFVLTGTKVYFLKRFYSQIQGGISYTETKTAGFPTDTELTPYFEFSLGINLFKNYLNEEEYE
jgi:hypothetical protein